MKKIAVVGIPGGWSSEKLADAVEAKTGFRLLVDMERVRLDLDSCRALYQGHDLGEMDAIIIKKIAPSYTPSVLDRLEILRFVEQRCGVPVFSKASSIMKLIDRLSCTVGLRNGGMPMPPTVITEDTDAAMEAVEEYGRAVFKPLFSTKARGMTVLEPCDELRENIEDYKAQGNPVMYIQQMVRHPGLDLGVTFLGGEYLATYARQGSGDSWNTTTRAGGKYVAQEPSKEIVDLARAAQDLFDMAFTCVDVVETPDGPKIYEVSAFGGFRGLLEANRIDAAARYVDFVLERIP
ncbi:GAK system ATP-grasp enzyme [Desulfohalovibrio reitneri]|uniref:GAK system ATP-grasp enzyme n=1 Tax=Desulfohalovibrio reitneri TaxID=1307759 RepID=UPI0004A7769F|nr:GAK system ATP-grasp enzyme [Desulfohalovibrio reitneri]